MQVKEFEAENLKACLQLVRDALGADAVILETRKTRKKGILGMGGRDMVNVVAATGISVKSDELVREQKPSAASPATKTSPSAVRSLYANTAESTQKMASVARDEAARTAAGQGAAIAANRVKPDLREAATQTAAAERLSFVERAMREIRDSLNAMQREQREAHERTVSALTAVTLPAASPAETSPILCPELHRRLLSAGYTDEAARELLDRLPDMSAWTEPARLPLATAALRDLLAHDLPCSGPIRLTPGKLKAVALIGPTGVGKTTTIAKLAAHFALVEKKRVGLLTMDTYRIAAVEHLKTYSQIIGIPVKVAYSQSEVLPATEEFHDYDLLLIDTAGRSQKNIMQVGELKTMLEPLHCETHLVLSASTKEQDMLDSVQRFSAARVDRIIFSKLDETSTHSSLLSVAEQCGKPISYLTTGQKVPEDIEVATGTSLASLVLP